MFSLLSMISRLGSENVLRQICIYLLQIQSSSSWIITMRSLSTKYLLPDPLLVLIEPPCKIAYKNLVRKKVLEYHHLNIVRDIKSKRSLRFLKAEYLPLGYGPPPLWLSCNGSISAIAAAKIQAKILSGRYRDDYLMSNFSKNPVGCCTLGSCGFFPGDVVHYLSGACKALSIQLSTTIIIIH